MKKISSYGDKELRRTQLKVLIDVIELTKNKKDLTLFLESFLSESEKAYLGQRLDIMRMLAKNFSYKEIREKICPSGSTINNAKKCLESGGAELANIILKYKFKPKKSRIIGPDNAVQPLVRPHYRGSIF